MKTQTVTVDPDDMQSLQRAEKGRALRRIAIGVLALFLLAGSAGAFGQRQGTVHRTAEHYALEVSYPRVSRGGLPATWSLRVRRTDGLPFAAPVEIVSDARYFVIFDHNGLDPEPSRTWQTADRLTWSFQPPRGAAELMVDLDVRIQPNAHLAHAGSSTLRIADLEVTTVHYRTWIAP